MAAKTELEWIEAIRRRAASGRFGRSLVLGIGDDCAILRPARGEDVVVTTDLTLEGVHFRRDLHAPESVGHRALARGLSDLAAMGARPLAAFLSIGLPAELAGGWFERFLGGWMALAKRHRVPLAGGDLAQAPAVRRGLGRAVMDVVLLGGVPSGRELRRSCARPDDALYVTGTLGGAAAELRSLLRGGGSRAPGERAHPHLYPEPRLRVGRKLAVEKLANSAIDLSDGLSTDLHHLCEASGVGALVNLKDIPVAPAASIEEALHGGEDYELLFTAPATRRLATVGGVRVHRIGAMTRKRGQVEIADGEGRRSRLAAGGWEHFRAREKTGKTVLGSSRTGRG